MSVNSSNDSNDAHYKTKMQRLFDEPKGKTDFSPAETFILHVFWQAPSITAAQRLLSGLKKCAIATHKNTPCTTTYFFRISSNDSPLCPAPPKTVYEHSQLSGALKKLRVGQPRGAVIADLIRRGLDPSYIDLELDAELPTELTRQQAVYVEFTEVYLDERAFMEHSASRDWLNAYGGKYYCVDSLHFYDFYTCCFETSIYRELLMF